MAGLLAYSIFAAFPSRFTGTVASSAKIIQSLQLRVQLRNLTGFPLDTQTGITNSSVNIRQNKFQDQKGKKKMQHNYQHEVNSVDNIKMQ